jgi:hypothetical protein
MIASRASLDHILRKSQPGLIVERVAFAILRQLVAGSARGGPASVFFVETDGASIAALDRLSGPGAVATVRRRRRVAALGRDTASGWLGRIDGRLGSQDRREAFYASP